jgi:predicted phage terminase large subunit-like protein
MAPAPERMYAEILRHDFSAFIHRSFLQLNASTKFLPNWHIEVLAAKLEAVRRGECKRLIVNIPPRHLKSHATSIAFPAWLLGHDPSKKILVVSYAKDFADKLARDSRELMRSPFYQALFDTKSSSEAASEYETTAGGYRLSASISGGITGRGADIVIIDDPIKTNEALSDSQRNSVNDWYDNTLRSRLNSQEDGAIIIVMQRVHADDLVAHVTAHEEWDVLSIPAIAEHDETYEFDTPYGRRRVVRSDGDTLQPELLSRDKLELLRRGMTEYNFAAQYQQNPQPASGNIVKRDWLKFYSLLDSPQNFEQIIQSWDTANKDTELANYSVCTTWGRKDRRLYLLDVFRRKLDFPNLKRTVKNQILLHSPTIVLIEDKASGTSLIQELRADGHSVVQAAPALDGDKTMRLRGQTAKIEGGFVLFPKDAPWFNTYVRELISFPNSKNDDQVDSTVFALAWFGSNQSSYGWTDESLDALGRLAGDSLYGRVMRSIGKPPW